MNRFKLSKWIKAEEKGGREHRDLKDVREASKHVGHRANKYWSRQR
jgi:hypothetical protein